MGGRALRGRCALTGLGPLVLAMACTTIGDPSADLDPRAASGDVGGSEPLRVARAIADHDARLTRALASRAKMDGFVAEDGRFTSPGWRDARDRRWAEIGAQLAERANGALVLGVSRFASSQLRLRPVGAAEAPGTLAQGHVVYPNGWGSGTDLLISSTRESVEMLMLVRTPAHRLTFGWHVDLPRDLTRVSSADDGGLAFVDARGETAIRVPPAYAIDARGVRRDAQLRWDARDGQLRVDVDATGLQAPILVDPAFETAFWEKVQTPANYYRGGGVYDEARGEVIFYDTKSTWTWDGAAWTEATQPSSPRTFGPIAYDAARRRAILFDNNTWAWDGKTWTNLQPAKSPSPREDSALAYDRVHGQVVLFGGAPTAQSVLADTWTFDGTTWTQRFPAHVPPARSLHAMVWDEVRARVVLVSGSPTGASYLNDTWSWDGTDWTLESPTNAAPNGAGFGATFDRNAGRILLYGGFWHDQETWSYDGTTWQKALPAATPGSRVQPALVFDAARNEPLLIGGPFTNQLDNDLWKWSGTTWIQKTSKRDQALSLATREKSAMAYDSARSKIVIFGGTDYADPFDDTWTWDGARWAATTPQTKPSPRFYHAMARDDARDRVVVFAGTRYKLLPNNSYGFEELSDTWSWDGTNWHDVTPASSPPPRFDHALAYDAKRGQIVLFGGAHADEQLQFTYLADTWIWDGASWTQRVTSGPSPRSAPAMAYDVAHDVVVLLGGWDGAQSSVDTWTWDGQQWTQRAPATSPTVDAYHLAYDRARGQVIAVGKTGLTWAWDGANWRELASPVSNLLPSAMDYDDTHRRTVVFTADRRTWLFSTRSGACGSGDECNSGFCVDGVCCDAPKCPGTCEACDTAADPGVCAPVLGAPDPDTCAGAQICDANGACRVALHETCATDAECASGHCADQICCDRACDGQCEACDTPDAPGTCVPVVGAPRGTRPACGGASLDEAVCATPACDGIDTTSCRGFADPDTPCRAPACTNGVATAAATCNGKGQCQTLVTSSCAPYACAGAACATRCATDDDCASSFRCDVASAQCVPRGEATCDGDHALATPTGETTECAPYRCEGNHCKSQCSSVADCAFPNECGKDGRCVAPATGAAPAVVRGCHVGPKSDADPPWIALAALAWALGRRAPRRVDSRRSSRPR